MFCVLLLLAVFCAGSQDRGLYPLGVTLVYPRDSGSECDKENCDPSFADDESVTQCGQ